MGGLLNAYAALLMDNCTYVSDSNGYWRFKSWTETLATNPSRLYLLTHAEWWVEKEVSPATRICHAIEDRARSNWREYCRNLTAHGRENRNDLPVALDSLPDLIGQRGEDVARMWLSGYHLESLFALNVEYGKMSKSHLRSKNQRLHDPKATSALIFDASLDGDDHAMSLLFAHLVEAMRATSVPEVLDNSFTKSTV